MMKAAVKIDIVIPEDHRLEITLPAELPPGPAEVIVLSESIRPGKGELRPIGIDVGKGKIAEDFDAPLPDDLQRLFEGRS